jgi:hypothetical protein
MSMPRNFNPEIFKGVSGISVSDKHVDFDNTWDSEKAKKFIKSALVAEKTFPEVTVKQFTPTEADYSEVRKRLKNPDRFDLKNFGFYEAMVADTKIDFKRERISKAVLDSLALQSIDGVSILVNHSHDNVIGHSYSGDVVAIPGQKGEFQFVSRFYVPDDAVMPNGQNAVKAIDSGIWKYVSIGFKNNDVKFIEPTQGGTEYFMEYVYNPEKPPVLIEFSMVYRGAQPRASLKTFEEEFTFETINNTMKKTFTFSGGFMENGTRKSLNVEVELPENGNADFSSIQAEIDTLANRVKALEGLENEVKALKTPVIESIKGIQKKIGTPEDADSVLQSFTLPELEAKLTSLKAIDDKLNPKNQATTPPSPVEAGKSNIFNY